MKSREGEQHLIHYFSKHVPWSSYGTLLSRCSGFIRDQAALVFFGFDPAVSLFVIIMRYVGMIRSLIGERALMGAFLPTFISMRSLNSGLAHQLFVFLKSSIVKGLSAIISCGIIFLYYQLNGWESNAFKLAIWLIPSVLFFVQHNLHVIFLHCHHTFFLPSIAPCLCNGMWLLGLFLARTKTGIDAMVVVSQWVFLGSILQWLATWIPMRYLLPPKKIGTFSCRDVDWKPFLKKLIFTLPTVAVFQINSQLDLLFADTMNIKGPAILGTTSRYYHLPITLFGTATLSAFLPLLTASIKGKRLEEAQSILGFAAEKLMGFMIPSTVILLYMATPIMSLVNHKISWEDQETASWCIRYYALGMLPSVFISLQAGLQYAREHFLITIYSAIGSMLINFALNVSIWRWQIMGVEGLALATTISSVCHATSLYYMTKNKEWRFRLSIKPILEVVIGSLISGVLAFLLIPSGKIGLLDALLFLLSYPILLFFYAYLTKQPTLSALFADYLPIHRLLPLFLAFKRGKKDPASRSI
ncbi:MAG: lipid II flippase MurJ [Chlamydiota bacterium]|nr:lipid II flippase MurJ [Chlamydiota bacterium]